MIHYFLQSYDRSGEEGRARRGLRVIKLLNLEKDQVTLIDQPIWIGKEQNGSNNVYDIVTTEE